MQKKRVFSGIQPTGQIHLGNYLGAIKHWVELQDEYENLFCIVNSHAITLPIEPIFLKSQTYELVKLLLACGISPKQSGLFIQSEVDEHPALAWLLDCQVSMGEMQRMTQFKDKSLKNPKSVNVGLFNYPILMASDILLYQSDLVPVGEDQKQHLELTRNVAEKFNRDFGNCFKVPEPLIAKVGARVMGLDDPKVKMSKSHKGANHAIFLLDEPDVIVKKIKKAATDSMGVIAFDETREGVFNLLNIYMLLSDESPEKIEERFRNKGYGDFKKELAEVVIQSLKPIQERYQEISDDEVKAVLNCGAEKARPLARATYQKAKELMGLI
ncbi:tryptophan--tRNA ligase [Helicobacter pylori]|uniref:Tryptophan--tRNA ligase n=1 Tax=Helicobacter pylori (strain J99 / ATCC 700824) TaxID=85963 RepID=SYW_HELPJ|nr:tryptophan--tRNA ligase [Helicobacter pylori]Q9ZJX4.1 RecName: Full=Tryptophan--tRNA ligase; AltName: Full=Tryptophanyl-tRNA synthetase; Short=TrpRS [Helicobacter pylori J99]AAD06748.1 TRYPTOPHANYL-TRNA SYNTHETASE [Helicobacter pylori J99]AKE82282.1 tryptophanyl-tRNA synthetase [Helicobacter pylori J99]AVL48329.1 tryptophan--tRNA ligase [Helicobacter pylori]MWR19525.1 tryptophan--tRNA ligase [Helicobacter pylori]MWR35353.1 tryptophan--tRNA ligase [Helicobacter pylori]